MTSPQFATAGAPFKFLPLVGGALSTGAGFAVGTVTAPTLRPILQDLENRTWQAHPSKPLDAEQVALALVEGVSNLDDARDEAGRTGISESRLEILRRISDEGIALSLAFEAWRRNNLSDAEFDAALKKAHIEERWWPAIRALKTARLTPAQIALGIVRSLLKDPGFLPVTLDTSGGKVPAYGVSTIDTLTEAEAAGLTTERLRVMVGEIGLPMSLQSAASATFRKIIERADFNRAVLEGDTRPEWADAIFEQAREIPSARDFIQGQLRGWLTEKQRGDGVARHGMSDADADLLFLIQGRPLSWHQVWIGLQRGGKYDGPINQIDPAFLKALRESNIRPEWYNLAWAQRYSYPSAFVLRSLVQTHVLTAAQGEADLLDMGWRPDRAKQVAEAWATGTAAKGDPHVTKANNSLWTTMVASYTAAESDAAALQPGFDQLDVPQAARQEILDTLDVRRDLIRKQLTPAQIKKAMSKTVPNEATGQPWSYDDALAALLSRGWSHADATTYLKT